MSVQVDRYIAELLYEQDKVTVPGLGIFSLNYKSAQTDPAQEILTPPAKVVSFRHSPESSNDRSLINHISTIEGISQEQSRQAVTDYVRSAREKLQRKELVLIDQVGRLYTDFEGTLQFLADATNFDTSTFGLPPISAKPVPTPPESVNAGLATQAAKAADTAPRTTFVQRHLGTIITVVLIVIVAIIFALSYQRFFGERSNDPTANVPEDRHNVAPPPAGDEEGLSDDPALDFPIDDANNHEVAPNNSETEDFDDSETEAITPAPNQQEAIIAIGIFQDKENVNSLVERIYKTGYEPYLDERNGRTRVGIQLSYQEFSEVQKALQLARREFAPDAFIMER